MVRVLQEGDSLAPNTSALLERFPTVSRPHTSEHDSSTNSDHLDSGTG